MYNYKQKLIGLIFLSCLMSCIETDFVEDEVTILEIEPIDRELINNSDLSGFIGDEIILSVTATNDRGKTFSPEVNWNSTNPAVASVDDTGTINLLSRGNTTIQATGFNLSSNVINVMVASDASEVALIEISTVNTSLSVGESIQLEATTLNANLMVLSSEVMWSSSNESIVEVDQTGLATALSNGSATISARSGDAVGSVTLTVGMSMSRTGEFMGLGGYNVSGDVELSENNGLQILLKENFTSSNGPGLYIYLSNDSRSISGGIEIGMLNKNSGADTYAVPAGVSLDQYDYVLVYCKPFGVSFGAAKLN